MRDLLPSSVVCCLPFMVVCGDVHRDCCRWLPFVVFVGIGERRRTNDGPLSGRPVVGNSVVMNRLRRRLVS